LIRVSFWRRRLLVGGLFLIGSILLFWGIPGGGGLGSGPVETGAVTEAYGPAGREGGQEARRQAPGERPPATDHGNGIGAGAPAHPHRDARGNASSAGGALAHGGDGGMSAEAPLPGRAPEAAGWSQGDPVRAQERAPEKKNGSEWAVGPPPAHAAVPPAARVRTGALGMKAPVYRYPRDFLDAAWRDVRRALASGSVPELKASLNRLYEAHLDTGFPDAPGVAAMLVREGYRLLERGDVARAQLLGHSAHDLAPDFFPVSDFASSLAGQDPDQGWKQSLLGAWIGLTQRWKAFDWQLRVLGRVFLVLLVSCWLLFLFLAPFFLLRYGKPLWHAVLERVQGGAGGRLQLALLCALGLLLLVFLPGLLWGVVIVGILLGGFMRNWERALFLLGLLVLALSPATLHLAARFLAPPPAASRVLCGCVQGDWDASCDQDLETALAMDPEGRDLLLTQALLENRR